MQDWEDRRLKFLNTASSNTPKGQLKHLPWHWIQLQGKKCTPTLKCCLELHSELYTKKRGIQVQPASQNVVTPTAFLIVKISHMLYVACYSLLYINSCIFCVKLKCGLLQKMKCCSVVNTFSLFLCHIYSYMWICRMKSCTMYNLLKNMSYSKWFSAAVQYVCFVSWT